MHYYGSPLGQVEQAAGARFSVADTLRQAFEAAKREALRRAGVAIASTPEGQAAIREEVAERARAAVVRAAPIGIPTLALAALAVWALMRRR